MNVTIRDIAASELEDLLALYGHLHESDEPVPERSRVEDTWQDILKNPRHKCFGVFMDE
jgi:hypothetical protein